MVAALVLSIGLHIALAAVWAMRVPPTSPATNAPPAVVQVRWARPLTQTTPAEPQTTERTVEPSEPRAAEAAVTEAAANAADTETPAARTKPAAATVLDLTLPQLPQTEPSQQNTTNGIFHPKLSRDFAQDNRQEQTTRDTIRSYTDSHGAEILVKGTQCMRVLPPADRHDTATVTLPVRCPWADDESETFAKSFREALKTRGYR